MVEFGIDFFYLRVVTQNEVKLALGKSKWDYFVSDYGIFVRFPRFSNVYVDIFCKYWLTEFYPVFNVSLRLNNPLNSAECKTAFLKLCVDVFCSTKPLIGIGRKGDYSKKEYESIRLFAEKGKLEDLLVRDWLGASTVPGVCPKFFSEEAFTIFKNVTELSSSPQYLKKLPCNGYIFGENFL